MTDTADSGPLTPNQVRWLKIAVVVMGIMIVVGIAILIGRILYLASQGPRQAATTVRTQATIGSPISLPAGAVIKNVSLAGDRLAIHYETSSAAGIAIVEVATGARIGHFDIVPVPPAPTAAPR